MIPYDHYELMIKKDDYIMPLGSKQWLLNVFDVWIIQEIHWKTLDETCLYLFFENDFYIG